MEQKFRDIYRYRSTDVAKYIVAEANSRRVGINMTKMQKLLYIVYGTFLCVYEERLVDEYPQAWPYGPVFPSTRKALLDVDMLSLSYTDIETNEHLKIKQDEDLKKVIDFAFTNFGIWNAGQLSEWSHREGSPWADTTKCKGFKWGDVIQDKLIYNYFKDLIMVDNTPD